MPRIAQAGGKAAFTRRGNISPPREPSRVPRSFGRISPLAQPLPPAQPRHGQSIFEVLRTMPLTAPAPGSDRRLSGEAHHVGGHPHRSDHEPHGSVPAVPRRQLGTRATMLLRRERAHLHTGDLPSVRRHWNQEARPRRRAPRRSSPMIRNIRGTISAVRAGTGYVWRGGRGNSPSCNGGLRSRVPDTCPMESTARATHGQ